MIGPGDGIAAVISTPVTDTDVDADLRATGERRTQPRERCDDRKPRICPGCGQPPDHAHDSKEETTLRR